jgi:hypothetical protein
MTTDRDALVYKGKSTMQESDSDDSVLLFFKGLMKKWRFENLVLGAWRLWFST